MVVMVVVHHLQGWWSTSSSKLELVGNYPCLPVACSKCHQSCLQSMTRYVAEQPTLAIILFIDRATHCVVLHHTSSLMEKSGGRRMHCSMLTCP